MYSIEKFCYNILSGNTTVVSCADMYVTAVLRDVDS
jgi:hypothetical protein